jgi:hypothetical protein
MFDCINCGFKGTDRESLRNHSCLTSSASWKERAEIRLASREAAAEKRCDAAEAAIAAIVGRDLDSSTFFQLRGLFSEWESAEEEMGEATERLNSL